MKVENSGARWKLKTLDIPWKLKSVDALASFSPSFLIPFLKHFFNRQCWHWFLEERCDDVADVHKLRNSSFLKINLVMLVIKSYNETSTKGAGNQNLKKDLTYGAGQWDSCDFLCTGSSGSSSPTSWKSSCNLRIEEYVSKFILSSAFCALTNMLVLQVPFYTSWQKFKASIGFQTWKNGV